MGDAPDDRTDAGIDGATRRTVLKATAGTLGVASMGSASAHDWGGTSSTASGDNTGGTHSRTDTLDTSKNAGIVGYHSLGGVGSARTAGRPEDPHHGAVTEIRTHGDYAYVGVFSSDSPTPGRGMAIVDISDFNRAETEAELDNASLSVVSFLRNNNTGVAVMDVKVADDGQFVFLGTQPYTALFTDEAKDPTPTTNDNSETVAPGGVVAVDVSDKGNPETVGLFEVSGTGVHNTFHHRIGGQDYVFAIHDLNDGTEGMYVFEFDRTTGQFTAVNRWTDAGDLAQGDTDTATKYIHDVEVQDDPKTGTPTAYLSYWDLGLQVLDLSNPADITQVGHFGMGSCHFASPAPDLVDGERRCIASQEIPASDTGTGTVHLLDAEGIYADEGITELEELDVWEWQNESMDDVDEIDFQNFTLSPHNSDLAKHVTQDPDTGAVTEEYWVHQAHYHGGVHYLQIDPANGTLTQQGYSRPVYEGVPDDSKMTGLSSVTPNVWGAVQSNGVTFASDINQGVHAIKHDDIPVTGPTPIVDVTRSDDGSAFTGGQTNQVDLSIRFTDEPVLLRDRLPKAWSVVAGDDNETYEAGGARIVEFAATASESDETRTYFAEAPSGAGATGEYTFGPVEFSADGGETWHAVPGTTETNTVVGTSTSLTLGAVAGGGGAFYRYREALAERLGGVLGRED
jgi:hypothetical protein